MEIAMTVALEVDPSAIGSYPLVRTGIADWILRAAAALRDLGPYAAIEFLLPGGGLSSYSCHGSIGVTRNRPQQ
jgi:hypothetical protein